MKKIVIIPNLIKDKGLAVTSNIARRLSELGYSLYIDSSVGEIKGAGVCLYDDVPNDADMIVVIGGDGSVIDASRMAIELDIPLLGVNLGKVGYLSEIEPENTDVFKDLSEGRYSVEEKMLLSAEYRKSNGETVVSERLAVNDVVISQDGYFGIADFTVENSRSETVSYRGNGVIIATPVGSTAYSLSAGGPVIAHNLDSITVTPVCPHSFFNRSIVYEPDERICVKNVGDLSLNISVDGRNFAVLSKGEECRITKSKHKLKMITFSRSNMFSALFKKIKLFEDKN